MCYFIGWLLFKAFFKFYLGFKVIGRRNVPNKGAFIFASNHQSYFDPIILGTALYRSLNYMAKEDLFRRPVARWALRKVHSIPVRREEGDLKAIKDAVRVLSSGKPLVIFPEGSRSKDGSLRKAKPGIGFIAAKTRVPVIPAYIEGSFEAMPRGIGTLNRHSVTIYIGNPIYFDWDKYDRNGKEAYQAISDDIMRRIAELKEIYADKVS